MSCGVGCRLGLDPVLLWLWLWLWLWCELVATAWEAPYAVGVALKRQKDPPPKKERYEKCHESDL